MNELKKMMHKFTIGINHMVQIIPQRYSTLIQVNPIQPFKKLYVGDKNQSA